MLLLYFLSSPKDSKKYFSSFDVHNIKVKKESFDLLNAFIDMEMIGKEYGIVFTD